MASLDDEPIRKLLRDRNYAVVSTLNHDGSVLSTVVWISAEDGAVAINSARGRRWPSNLERDPRVTVLVMEGGNPYNDVEIEGVATASSEGADEHIDALSKKYTGQDQFQGRRPGDERVKFTIRPTRVRHQQQA